MNESIALTKKPIEISNRVIDKSTTDFVLSETLTRPRMSYLKIIRSSFKSQTDAIQFLNSLRKTTIASLYFNNTDLNEDQVSCLCTSMREMGVRDLTICNANLTTKSIQTLSHAMEEMYILTAISLRNNQIDSSAANYISRAITNSSINYLDLSYNPLGISIIQETFSQKISLRSLILIRIDLTQQGIELLCELIQTHHIPIECLDVTLNYLTNVNCIAHLITNPEIPLSILNISRNPFPTITPLIDNLKYSASLEFLNLRLIDSITDHDGLHILDQELNLTKLSTLQLHSMRLSPEIETRITEKISRIQGPKTKTLVALLSSKQSRLGSKSLFARLFPRELIRLIALYI